MCKNIDYCASYISMGDKQYSAAEAARFMDQGGLWQWRQLILILLSFTSSAMQSFSVVFIGFQPKFACLDNVEESTPWNLTNYILLDDRCTRADNSTGTSSDQCHTGFNYSVKREESIVSQWDLVCEKAYLSEVSQLLYTLGMGVGALIIGPLSDRIGRRICFLIARVLSLSFSTCLIFSPGIEVFMVLRFLIGLHDMACGLIRSVYITELTPLKYRPLTTSMAGILWALALCMEALIGHLTRGWNWRYFQAIITAFSLLAILEIIFLRESLNWLFANGKAKEATFILKAAFKTNGITDADICLSQELIQPLTMKLPDKTVECQDTESQVSAKENMGTGIPNKSTTVPPQERKITIIDIMKNSTSRRLLLILCFVWLVNTLVYYGLFLMSSAMIGDRVLNFFIIAIVEIPSCFALYIILLYFGRKTALIGCHAVCAFCLLLAGVFNFTMDGDTKDMSMQIVTFIGKFGISASFLMLYFYTTESLPTNFRTTGVGITSFSARCGSLLAPFSSVLLRVLPWGPGIIFGCLCALASGLLVLVPKTDHRQLPQTISEMESWKNEKVAQKE